ncbi:Xaa-Pro aminopeptidase [Sphingomonas spermidinifaciens]|uniref:Xaa-Pro aminopeptidase n=1 Tax=Sphingomonas spermidinifaciens TaxID=1141889 RepID=A0A2A4B2P0_9SPHN|nr:M24 family metallopeptidase [Sphingomonas spermidinifaciens]PCD01954.1 Xaa-Pro aminopeptidase [Sphingomonas spermidinifaciens]
MKRLGLVLGLLASPAWAQLGESARPQLPPVPSLRERAATIDASLKERLDTVIPAIMRERGVDMWVLVARENFEEPVVATMLDSEAFSARRRTILVFHDPGEGRPVERLTVSRYGLGGLFAPAWDPATQPDQWKALADIIAARAPKRIAINSSAASAYADGMTLSAWEEMNAALPPELRTRVVRDGTLAIRWLESRTPRELADYPRIVGTAQAIIAEGFSNKAIQPGKTTSADLVWWYRERIAGLKLETWFQPSVGIQRQGAKGMLEGDTVIRPGDLLWVDFGIVTERLATDTQHLAYVLKTGETEAPAGLRAGLAAANRLQDITMAAFRAGDSGNAILARARAAAIAQGITPSIYSHPVGFHGHAAGSAIGFWDNQGPDPRGEGPVRAGTTWSIELMAKAAVPEWGGQVVEFRQEEDAVFDGRQVRWLNGRQTGFYLVR